MSNEELGGLAKSKLEPLAQVEQLRNQGKTKKALDTSLKQGCIALK